MTSPSTPLTLAQVGPLARHFERSGLGLLRVEVPGLALRLVAAAPASAAGAAALAPSQAQQAVPVAAAPAAAASSSPAVDVKAGLVGIFLASHPARGRLRAETGQRVAAGDVLGVVAQAKGELFHAVRAPCAGTIAQRWIHDGERVQFGSRLFGILPDH